LFFDLDNDNLLPMLKTDSTRSIRFKWPIIGHELQRRYLEKIISDGLINQAYLFHGHHGIGKQQVAINFAQATVCTDQKKRPCQKCLNCLAYLKNNHPDTMVVQLNNGENSINIDQVRRITTFTKRSRSLASYKFVIVFGLERFTNAAANALLKTLEEPPPRVVVVATANLLKSLPQTIISRCQALKFYALTRAEIKRAIYSSGLSNQEIDTFIAYSYGQLIRLNKLIGEPANIYERNIDQAMKLLESDLSGQLDITDQLIKQVRTSKATIRAFEVGDELIKIINRVESLARDAVHIKLNSTRLTHCKFRERISQYAAQTKINHLKSLLLALGELRITISRHSPIQLATDYLFLKNKYLLPFIHGNQS
jgi:DNA polymerase III subunit delta'